MSLGEICLDGIIVFRGIAALKQNLNQHVWVGISQHLSRAAASSPPRVRYMWPTTAASDHTCPWTPAQRPSRAVDLPSPHTRYMQRTTAASHHRCPWTPAQRPSRATASLPPHAPSLQPTIAAPNHRCPWTLAQRPSRAAASPECSLVRQTDGWTADGLVSAVHPSK